ncbi:MAG TPA: hypothetical protein VF494_04935 [Candidatus Limnocylindrales bacterium]
MPNPQDDLRSTADSIRRDVELVKQLEEQKESLDISDPRFERLSARIEHLASALHGKAAAERELTQELNGGQ